MAVITVDGILLDMDMVGPSSIGENPVSLFREQLDEAAADPCTRAVVVRINSYGGSAAASDIMRHELEQFKLRTRLPVVACITGTGAGARITWRLRPIKLSPCRYRLSVAWV